MPVDQVRSARVVTRYIRAAGLRKAEVARRMGVTRSLITLWSSEGVRGRLITPEQVIPFLRAVGGGHPFKLRPDLYPDRSWVV